MKIEMNTTGDRATVQVTGDVDEQGAEELKSYLSGVDFKTIREVYLDLTRVDYIGSAGVGKLMLFYKKMALNNGKVSIGSSGEVYELLQELKLGTLFSLVKG